MSDSVVSLPIGAEVLPGKRCLKDHVEAKTLSEHCVNRVGSKKVGTLQFIEQNDRLASAESSRYLSITFTLRVEGKLHSHKAS